MFKAIVILRAIETDSTGKPYPSIPASWDFSCHEDDWCSIYPDTFSGSAVINARLMVQSGSTGGFIVHSAPRILLRILESVTFSWTINQLRQDSGSVAMQLKQAWRDLSESSEASLFSNISGYNIITDLETTTEVPVSGSG